MPVNFRRFLLILERLEGVLWGWRTFSFGRVASREGKRNSISVAIRRLADFGLAVR